MRTVKELLDKNIPYSDMEDDEIEALVEYKSTVKANSIDYQQRLEMQREYHNLMTQYQAEIARESMRYTQELCDKLLGGIN